MVLSCNLPEPELVKLKWCILTWYPSGVGDPGPGDAPL